MSDIGLVCNFFWIGGRGTGWFQYGKDIEIAGKLREIIHVWNFGNSTSSSKGKIYIQF